MHFTGTKSSSVSIFSSVMAVRKAKLPKIPTATTTTYRNVLIDFSRTVKAATLIFISGVVRLFHLLRQANQVLFIIPW